MDLIILIFSIFGNLALGLLVYFKNPHSSTNKLFAALSGSIILMVITNYFSVVTQIAEDPIIILFWIRMTMFSAALVGLFYYLFVHTFPKQKIPLTKNKITALFILTIATMITALSPYLFTELNISEGTVQPIPGPGIILFLIGLLLYRKN